MSIKYARLFIAVFAVAFAAFVAVQFKRRAPASAPVVNGRTDPTALIESKGGTLTRWSSSREDVEIRYERQLTYSDGSSKLIGVTVETTERGSGKRTFKLTAREGKAGQNESSYVLDGGIELRASDGMVVRTDHATYTGNEKIVRAPGPTSFERGRFSGSGVGMTYDEANAVMTLEQQAIVHVKPDEKGEGAADITSGTATFARRDKYFRFEKGVKVQRPDQLIETETATGHLSADENHIETVELRANARITSSKAAVGALQSLSGRDMDLKYAPKGDTLEHARIEGDGVIRVAGETGKPPREIAATTIDVALAPDGSTPTALVARDRVQLTIPPEPKIVGRTIRSSALDARGEAGRGLTRALFTGSVTYREQGSENNRDANASSLDVGLKPGMSEIEDAKFAHAIRFEQGRMVALAAEADYDPDKGTLALRGSERGREVPHVEDDQIAVDAAKIDMTLAESSAAGEPAAGHGGSKMHAIGAPVKSVIQPPSKTAKPEDRVKMPTMLKQDQPVTVLAGTLDYDGDASKATYSGDVRLFQGDTSIKAASMILDDKSGDLTASGSVMTTTMLEQVNEKDKTKKDKVHSTGTSKDFKYEDNVRRLTYTGEAHLNGPQGDMSAERIELFLKESGDELDRAEAYEKLTLKEQSRVTTGTRMTYTTADDKYVVTGAPVDIVDQCGRKTTGRTLTFIKATDTIVVDGNDQIRTQTRGGTAACK